MFTMGGYAMAFLITMEDILGGFAKTNLPWSVHITTLALGSQPKQGAWKGVGQKCNSKVTFTFPRVWKSVTEWTHTLPSGLPLWKLEFQWILEFSHNNLMYQNSLDWKFPYTIRKLLKHTCLQWACMIYLSNKNISYGQ
jgi:hypothetical protein